MPARRFASREIFLFGFILATLIPLLAVAQSADLVAYQQDGLWGYRTRDGRVVIQPRYGIANPFSKEGIAAVADEDGWAYIDRTGKVVLKPYIFDNYPDEFAEGLARFKVDGKFGFFDRRGRIVIQPRFAFAKPFSGGFAAVCEGCREVADGDHKRVEGGRWGFIDRAAQLVIPFQFEHAESFRKGRAAVMVNGRWKRVDKRGAIS